jgi:hypothetical protein
MKKKNPRFRNNEVSVLVVLVLLFQHPALVLVALLSLQVVGLENSFLNHYLSYFRQQLICHLLLAVYFCRLSLLKVHMESSSLTPLPFSSRRACLLATFSGFVY